MEKIILSLEQFLSSYIKDNKFCGQLGEIPKLRVNQLEFIISRMEKKAKEFGNVGT